MLSDSYTVMLSDSYTVILSDSYLVQHKIAKVIPLFKWMIQH